jgi:hypothetical protein
MDALGLTIEFLSTHDPITVPTDTGKSLYYPVPAIQELFFIRQIHTENNHNPVVVDTFSLSMPEVIQKSKLTMDKSLSSIDQSALPPTEDEIEAMRKMVDNENEE